MNFTDFRQVGDITDPRIISGWLTTTWYPFQLIMDDPNNPKSSHQLPIRLTPCSMRTYRQLVRDSRRPVSAVSHA